MKPTIKITYDIVTHESAALGDFAETGWINKKGITFDSIQECAEYLVDQGPFEPSSSLFHKGIYYTQADPDIDLHTGDQERYTFHCYNMSEKQELELYTRLIGVD